MPLPQAGCQTSRIGETHVTAPAAGTRDTSPAALILVYCSLAEIIIAQAQAGDPSYSFATLAGTAGSQGYVDAEGSAARFNGPFGIAADTDGNVYVSDTGIHLVRKIDPTGNVSTFAMLGFPEGLAVDRDGVIYVADDGCNKIYRITRDGMMSVLAGSGVAGSADGMGTAAQFNAPLGVAVDGGGNVYVADANNHTIRQISPAGYVSTLAGLAGSTGFGFVDGTGSAARFVFTQAVATDSGGNNIYVVDNDTIRRITPVGVVTTIAGSPGASGSSDGTASAARFKDPAGVAVDNNGEVYVADAGNYTLRKVSSGNVVTTVAGSPGNIGANDGDGNATRFNYLGGVAVDITGSIYIADHNNYTVRLGGTSVISQTLKVFELPSGLMLTGHAAPSSAVVVSATSDLQTSFEMIATVEANAVGAFRYQDTSSETYRSRFYSATIPSH